MYLTENIIENAEEQIQQAGKFSEQLLNGFLAYLPSLIAAVVILVVGLLLSKLILALMSKGMKRAAADLTVSKFMHSLVKIALYILTATIVLAILGVPMTSIIAVIGTAGVAIGLALQDSLSNVAGGFNILLTKPFRVGDYIEANGTEGTVEMISIWYTLLMTYDNKAVFIPNGEIVKSRVTNYTYNKQRRIDLTFSVSYKADIDKAVEVLKKTAAANPKILSDPPTDVCVSALGESAVEIACRPWVKTEDYWQVYFDLTLSVKKALDENGIEIPYNQLDVHIDKT